MKFKSHVTVGRHILHPVVLNWARDFYKSLPETARPDLPPRTEPEARRLQRRFDDWSRYLIVDGSQS